MKPPWIAFPFVNPVEGASAKFLEYGNRWEDWFSSRTPTEQDCYEQENPEPAGKWRGFYDNIRGRHIQRSRSKIKWDDANPWHGHFLVILDCKCTHCGVAAPTLDIYERYRKRPARQYPFSLYKFCVQAAQGVESLGWHIPDDRPCCPECWAKLHPILLKDPARNTP